MFRPSITDYLATLENPAGVFRTLFPARDDAPVFERDLYGELAFRAGNAAAVFRFLRDGRWRLLKLYIRPNPYLREIYEYVELVQREGRTGASILPRVRLLRDELFVLSPSGSSGWVDVVEGEWIEGVTLASFDVRSDFATGLTAPVCKVCAQSTNHSIAVASDKASKQKAALEELFHELRDAEWAHGDLKPENIIVSRSGKELSPNSSRSGTTTTSEFRMTLIDCDAMWIPSFGEHTDDHPCGRPAVELGTSPWSVRATQAALRQTQEYASVPFDKSIDDYPMERIREWLGL